MNRASSVSSRASRAKAILKELTDEEVAFLEADWFYRARPEQLAPPGDWRIWLFLGGRGAGKTRSGAEWIADGVANGTMRRIGLVGATFHDARAVMIEGESGLARIAGNAAVFEPSNRRVLWSNGAVASVLSADEPDSIRGHQFDTVWADELGCPAVDKGANEPNVFVDPKSIESSRPYYSSGARDDLMQRRFLEAHFRFWADAANNPQSPHYAGRMVDNANIYVWCWDARPFPYFPALSDLWGDAANYTNGDWLNGRLGAVGLAGVVRAICADSGFDAIDTSALNGLLTGFAVTDTMSARDALTPLSVAYQFDAVESGGVIRFVPRGQAQAPQLTADDLVLPDDAPATSFVRAQETDLPNVSRVAYLDAADYRLASADARRMVTLSDRVASSSLPIVMDQDVAIGIGQRLLQDAWVMRETASFALPPSHLARDVTDEVTLAIGGRAHRLRLTSIDDGAARAVQAVATDPSVYDMIKGPVRAGGAMTVPVQPGRPAVAFLDLPLLTGSEVPWAPHVAAFASPWPGSELVFRSAGDSNFTLDTTIRFAATMGRLTADLAAGPLWCWDEGNVLSVSLSSGALASQDDLSVLGGANAIAVQNPKGDWEVIQFAQALLTAPGQWTLSRLLRGQSGTEGAMGAASGARVVLLDGALQQLALTQGEATRPFNYACGPPYRPLSDPSYQIQNLQFAAIGLRPLSPVHLTATRQANGDHLLSWTRRTRVGGDDWEPSDVPLGEDSEVYTVDILRGGAVVRTLQTSQPSVLYTAAMAATDFPSGGPLHFTVAQISTAFGRGAVASA